MKFLSVFIFKIFTENYDFFFLCKEKPNEKFTKRKQTQNFSKSPMHKNRKEKEKRVFLKLSLKQVFLAMRVYN